MFETKLNIFCKPEKFREIKFYLYFFIFFLLRFCEIEFKAFEKTKKIVKSDLCI